VPLTEQTAEHLRRAGCPDIAPVIPHGVDTARFRPLGPSARRRLRERWELGGGGDGSADRASGTAFVVGAVGAHTTRKRLDLVLESFARFASAFPRSLLVVKTDRLRSAEGTDLQAITRRLGIEGRVRLITAELPTAAMAGLYNCFDVLLALAEWEGFGIPVIEAMSCGVPVVTHPGQGPGEVVPYRELLVPGSRRREEGGALLLEARPDLAAEVLGRACEQPQRLRSLAEQGRAEVLRLYDIDRVAARWLTLIDPE
jgi:glycosyltransferase involved in cell wall biosynthesis